MARIGCVSYLNTRPLIEGLDALAGVQIIGAVPSKLVGLLERDEADVALVSLIDAARSAVPLSVLPVGMIGSDGPTLTVRLYAQLPLDQIRRIHADTDSHTSVALCRVLLADKFGIYPDMVDFDARERVGLDGREGQSEWPEAMLLIGDKVVTDSPPAVRYPHQLDLGEAWAEQTGLPFVYAVWMCRRGRVDDPEVMRAAVLLERQRLHNRTRLDHIVATRAPEHRWPMDLAGRYLGVCLRYSFDDRARQAAGVFLERCRALGLVGQSELHIADVQPSALG